MKVLLDYWVFDHLATGGIYRYFLNLLRQAQHADQLHFKPALLYSEGKDLPNEFKFWSKPGYQSNSKLVKRGGKIYSRSINLMYSAAQTLFSEYEIYHPTYYSPFLINKIKTPIAVTVYDMIHELFPQYIGKLDFTARNKKILCEKADIIFAISEHTKSDLVNILGINPDKIKVTYLSGGFDPIPMSESLKKKLPKRYLLFTGHRDGYKNFERFFRAIVPLLLKDEDLSILCTGRPFNRFELNLFDSLNVSSRVYHHFAADTEFYSIYNNALAFVFPSMYEGFGIPVLEAFSSDCPAIISNSSSLKEIGSDAAAYFNPFNEEGIRDSIEKVIYNTSVRADMITKGQKRLKDFSWERTYTDTLQGYQSLIK